MISDGRILSENLHRLQLDEQWLHKQLADRGMNDPREVFLMTVDDGKNVFLVEQEKEK